MGDMTSWRTWTAAAVLILLAAPESLAWGARLHMDISRAAARSVPDEMGEWRRYARLMAANSLNPDLWKQNDPTEGPRHFIDVERYRGFAITNLPRDRAEFQAMGPVAAAANGTLPWSIQELQIRLTSAMASNEWTEALCIAATLGHYVADLHQPLHTTENYDGTMGDDQGVHLRWEETMPMHYWRAMMLQVGEVKHVPDLWPELLRWIQKAHMQYELVLTADRAASKMARGNTDSRVYYRSLWENTKDIFINQVSDAATHLASVWCTAWVNAGKPAIPRPPDGVPPESVWARAGGRRAPSALPFFIAFAAIAAVVIGLSLRRRPRQASSPS